MTHEEWVKLTPEEQRIKVAGLCGWRQNEIQTNLGGKRRTKMTWLNTVTGFNFAMPPDYLNDLNAMHEAEKKIHVTLIGKYIRSVSDRIRHRELGGSTDNARDDWAGVHATAAQRAEAFVLTMEAENDR